MVISTVKMYLIFICTLIVYFAPCLANKRPSQGAQISSLLVPGTHLELNGESAKACPDIAHALSCNESNFHHAGKAKILVDVDCYVAKRAQNWTKLEVQITKCREAVTSNTCEHFQTWKWTRNLEQIIFDPRAMWAPLVQSIQPPANLPFVAGPRHIRNATLNMNAIDKFPIPLEGYIWKPRVKLFDENNDIHMCFDVQTRFSRVKDG